MGYCPPACDGSRYMELYLDTRLGRQSWARDRRRDTAGLERSRTLRHGRLARGASGACARMAWPLGGGGGGGLRYKWVYRDRRGRPSVTTQHAKGCYTA